MATWYSRTWPSGKVSWYTKVKDAAGDWKPVLLRGVKSEPAAKKMAEEMERARQRADHGLPAASPFTGNFAELCAWAHKIHFSKQGSAQPDQSMLRTHAGNPEKGTATWLGALPVRKVTGAKLAQYFSELTERLTVRGKPYSPGAINRVRALFATVFEQAKEHGYWVGDNPVHATSARPEVKASFDILEAHEVAPTLAACDPYWRGCLAVGILAGLRKGEIFGLMKRDVDLKRRALLVRRSHGRQTTKGGTHAAVPIHEDLIPYLEEWLATPGPVLFPNHDGGRRSQHVDLPRILQMAMVRAGFIDRWEYACRRSVGGVKCGFRDEQPTESKRDCPQCGFRLWATPRARSIRWHEGTRHTLASHALMSGAGLASVQAILRHADPRLTIETYGHLSSGFLADEVNRVAIPGLQAKPADAEQPAASARHAVEPTPHAVHTAPPRRGAPMVRGGQRAHQQAAVGIMNRHQKGFESEWSRGDLNPRPMHCEGKGGVSAVAPPVGTASQPLANVGTADRVNSTPLPTVTPRPRGRGAPMVRSADSAHHAGRTAYVGGSPQTTEQPAGEMFTVQQVADRLSVGRTWVRRRIEAGDLPVVKTHPTAPALVPAAALAAYLERFPGILPAEAPAPAEAPVVAPARARKGAA